MTKREKSAISVTYTNEELTQHGTTEFPIRTFTEITLAEETGIIPWHWHRELEMISCTKGHMMVYTETDTYTLKAGEAIFINSKVLHQVKPFPGEKPIHYSYCFSPEFLSGTPDNLSAQKYIFPFVEGKGPFSYLFKSDTPWEQECLNILFELNKESLNENYGYELFLQSKILYLLLLMLRNLPEKVDSDALDLSIKNSVVRNMISYIRNHYTCKISLDELTEISNLSRSSCNRLFHKTVGCTPFEYLTDYRLKRSIHLLRESEKSITEIAYMCGFSDTSYYCKVFRNKNGISPAKFRSLQETAQQSR